MHFAGALLVACLAAGVGFVLVQLRTHTTTATAAANHHSACALADWLTLEAHERKVFSQNGEDGVLRRIFELVGTTNKVGVEFGVQDGSERNTRLLASDPQWRTLLMDNEHKGGPHNITKAFVTPKNILRLLRRHDIPTDFDLLSVDIDCHDFWVLRAVLAPSSAFRPRVIVTEVNAGLDPTELLTVPPPPGECGFTTFFGASVGAFAALTMRAGYSMVYCETMGVNCFHVRDDVVGCDTPLSSLLSVRMLHRPPRYGRYCGGHPPDPLQREFWHVTPELLWGEG